MAGYHKVKITLIHQNRRCHVGHEVGDEWVVGRYTPTGMCLGAFSSLAPYITALRFGANFPWEQQPGEASIACPDGQVCNTFHLKRLDETD